VRWSLAHAPAADLATYPEEPLGEGDELGALRRGDEAAFVDLTRRLHGPMLRLALAYVGDHHVAEDVVQEAWLTAIRSLDRFEGRSSFKTWISGIVINLARARRRKESRWLTIGALMRRRGDRGPTVDPSRFGDDGAWKDFPRRWDNEPEEIVLAGETLEVVRKAIDALPARHREVIVMRDVAQLDAPAVTELLGISPENQRVRLHRARAAVRKALEAYLG
jgi:RNA polymerase sigma-70 factor, ECF subfamily